MRYNITHTTTYDYSETVSVSHHIARLHPRSLSRQNCLWHELIIDPAPAVTSEFFDYFGNSVTFFAMQGAHEKLNLHSRSEVDVAVAMAPLAAVTSPWETVRDRFGSDLDAATLEAHEFCFDSTLIKTNAEFAGYAAASFPARRPLLEAVIDLTWRIHQDFTFDPKATTVATPLDEVFRTRRGVCQDFAQFQIACLRSLRLPARYVSGYLETKPAPNRPRLVGAAASHAWVSVFSPGAGWIDVDPTNNLVPANRHITLAWGRDYSDVSPLRGVILGGGKHSLKVAVDVAPQNTEG
jgi:transglutaminase-like putative cysteine protease